MRKKLLFIMAVLLCAPIVKSWAQSSRFGVVFSVTDATCYNNGKVAYALVDGAGNPLAALPSGVSQVRAYYKLSEADSAHYSGLYYSGGTDTLTVNYGTYIIGVEALWPDGRGGYMRADTHTVLAVGTSYRKPEASALYAMAASPTGAGRRPTLSCVHNGRIQLKIEGGRFPYTVAVRNHDNGSLLRTVVFRQPQYSGSQDSLYDYRDYYTFDSLPAGDWDFYLTDGCEYGLPRVGQQVETVDFPQLDRVEVFASSGDFNDHNVVKINAVLDKDFSCFADLLPQYAQYRFRCSGLSEGVWKPFPAIFPGYRAVLCDTVQAADRYCEIWDRNISFEYKVTACGTTVSSRQFQLHRPNPEHFEKDYSDFRDSTLSDHDTCTDKWYWHRHFYSIRYYYQGAPAGKYSPSYANRDDDHIHYRYHYTHPLTWIYTDTQTGAVVKRDTVGVITDFSYLYDRDVKAVYGSFEDEERRIRLERRLEDGNGCTLFATVDTLAYLYAVGQEIADWRFEQSSSDHCCYTPRSVSVFEHHHSDVDPDGTIIRLVTSPLGSRYNFSAVYRSKSNSWDVFKYSLENTADVIGATDGRSLQVQEYCLPSGPYVFEIVTPCSTFTVSRNVNFVSTYVTEIQEAPVFETERECTDFYLTYTAGYFARLGYNTSTETGLPLPPEVTPLQTRFQVVSGPPGGYDAVDHGVGERIRISMPGTYIIRMYSVSNVAMCSVPEYFDTVYYDGATVEFVYANALLCDSLSTSGNAYVRGTNGTEPYTYTLYDQPDKQGNVLGVNSSGVFLDVPMRADREMSCLIRDACNAYFHVNFYPRTLADLQKLWFDGGVTETTACEGVTLQVHALSIGDILQYEWTGPDGFQATSSDPYVFVPRGASEGWYKVTIRNSGCAEFLTDSIFLHVQPSPDVTLSGSTLACPGEEVEVRFLPSSPVATDSVSFTMAFDNAAGIETRTYTAAPGAMVTDRYKTSTPAKIYPVWVYDGRCDYSLADPDDTLYIDMRGDLADACTILTTHDTVCYGGDAHVTARSTMEPPYTLRWYGDYALSQLLKTELVGGSGIGSSYDTAGILQRTLLYVAIEKPNVCPTVNGLVTNTMNMHNGTTVLACGEHYRVYDSGGAEGPSSLNESLTHRFQTTDGKPVSIRFEELSLSTTAHLFVVSGSELRADSVLVELTSRSAVPDVAFSRGNTLTLFFQSGMKPSAGWSAVVEHSPGVAVADVWRRNHVELHDEVCQSQAGHYDDPYGLVPAFVSREAADQALRKAGTYTFSATIPGADMRGCDSAVTFRLTVNNPPRHDTTIVTTNLHGGRCVWHDSTYTSTGRYTHLVTLPDGCDSLNVLDFIVLQVDTTLGGVCPGDTAELSVSVSTPELPEQDMALLPRVYVGDVLCSDMTVLRPELFLVSGKVPIGVVFYVDGTGLHGMAVAVRDTNLNVAGSGSYVFSTLPLFRSVNVALQDMDGLERTFQIKNEAESIGNHDFATNSPAAHYCHTLDPVTNKAGAVPTGWYMPSMGELNLLYGAFYEVGLTLRKLRSAGWRARYDLNQCWSSTYERDSYFWSVSSMGEAIRVTTHNGPRNVRAITRF